MGGRVGAGADRAPYSLETLHIGASSAAHEAGSTFQPDRPAYDIDFDSRDFDGFVDIGSDEADPPAIGDRVWEDLDGDGIQDVGEPGMVSALVYLLDGGGAIRDVRFTNVFGGYRFLGLTPGETYKVRFIPPPGFVITQLDQGTDDSVDSDADPVTGDTLPVVPDRRITPFKYDTGMISTAPCYPPDEAIYVYNVRLSTDGNNFPILDFMDFNQPEQISGYNIYRSSDPNPATWPLVADDIVDGDEGTPNRQWVDISGDVSPTSIWYYHVTAFNNRCPAEGPF